MIKVRITCSRGLLVAAIALSACSDGGDSGASETRDAGASPSVTSKDAGTTSTGALDAGASNPIGDLINSFLGDGGLSGLGSLFGDAGLGGLAGLFGDGGLGGLGGLFGDGGFPNFGDGGFDPATICARFPQFCPDAGSAVDSGVDAGDAGPSDAGPSDAGPSDAGPSDAGPSDAGSDASDSSDDASSAEAIPEADD